MADQSPKWKRPSDVMKMRRKRKAIVRTGSSEAKNINSPVTQSSVNNIPRSKPVKRRNPFGCSPRKKSSLCSLSSDDPVKDSGLEDKGQVVAGSILLEVLGPSGAKPLESLEISTVKKTGIPSTITAAQADALRGDVPQASLPQDEAQEEEKEEEKLGSPYLPTDWSLKTKMRFMSHKPFNWCTSLKSSEESHGIQQFIQGHATIDQATHAPGSKEAKTEFHRHTQYWMHPNIPWLKLFPRIIDDNKFGKSNAIMNDEAVQKALMADWSDSFTSAFHAVRNSTCPYFYLCTHQQTVLFRAGGVGQRSQVHAIITPTSRGFRESLKKEDIEFSMPLANKMDLDSEKENTSQDDSAKEESFPKALTKSGELDDDEDEDDIVDTDEGASSWLNSIGVNAAKFRSLDPNKIKMSREGYRVIDHRPESMLLVEGADTQALFNYLLNCRSLIATAGAQTGIPPTLLAPVSFRGATLKCLKVKSGLLHIPGAQQGYSLEVTGPMLPFHSHGLTKLFSHTQDSFSATASVHEATSPLNAVLAEGDAQDEEEVSDELKNSVVAESHLQNATKANDLGKQAMREVEFEKCLFSWTT